MFVIDKVLKKSQLLHVSAVYTQTDWNLAGRYQKICAAF